MRVYHSHGYETGLTGAAEEGEGKEEDHERTSFHLGPACVNAGEAVG